MLLLRDTNDNPILAISAKAVEAGANVVGAGEVVTVVVGEYENDRLFVYEWVDPDDESEGTKSTSERWLHPDELVLVHLDAS